MWPNGLCVRKQVLLELTDCVVVSNTIDRLVFILACYISTQLPVCSLIVRTNYKNQFWAKGQKIARKNMNYKNCMHYMIHPWKWNKCVYFVYKHVDCKWHFTVLVCEYPLFAGIHTSALVNTFLFKIQNSMIHFFWRPPTYFSCNINFTLRFITLQILSFSFFTVWELFFGD